MVSGRRVPKTHPRIEAYGTIDELMSVIGIVRSFNSQKESSERREKFEVILQAIQQKLFDIGSQLATLPGDEYEGQVQVKRQDVEWLETVIDAMNAELSPLTSFILPGGSPSMLSCIRLAPSVGALNEKCFVFASMKTSVMLSFLISIVSLTHCLSLAAGSAALGEREILWEAGKDLPDWHWIHKVGFNNIPG